MEQPSAPYIETSPFEPLIEMQPGQISGTAEILAVNHGNAAVQIGSVTIPTPLADSSLTTTCVGTLTPGKSCRIVVTVLATDAALIGESVYINDPSGALLQRTGVEAVLGYSALRSEVTTVQMGNVSVGHSAQNEVTITNDGAPTTPSTALTGDSAFSSTGCTSVVERFASCSITVKFSPIELGPQTATLDLRPSESGQSGVSVALSAQGVPSDLDLSASALQFSGAPGEAQTVRVDNQTDSEQTVQTALVTGPFSIQNGCSAIQPGSYCNIGVSYAPSSINTGVADRGDLTVFSSDDDRAHKVDLSVLNDGPAVAASPEAINFPNQQVGSSSAPQTITVTNSGSEPAALRTSVAGNFVLQNGCAGIVAPGGTCSVQLAFAPIMAGASEGALLLSGPGGLRMISLSGTGIPPPSASIAVSATAVDFGQEQIGSTGTPQSVTVTNSGSAGTPLSTYAAGDFAILNGCEGTLGSGSSCKIQLAFSPATSGQRNGILLISDRGSVHEVSLQGMGTPRPSPAPPPSSHTPAILGATVGGLGIGLPLVLHHTTNAAMPPSVRASPSQLVLNCKSGGCSASAAIDLYSERLKGHELVLLASEPFTVAGCEALDRSGKCVATVRFRSSTVGVHHGIVAVSDADGRPLALVSVKGVVHAAPAPVRSEQESADRCESVGRRIAEVGIGADILRLPSCCETRGIHFGLPTLPSCRL